MACVTVDNFCLSEDELHNTPSRKEGIDKDTETKIRFYGCNLIQKSGILLRLPQSAMAVGQVLFHRFYRQKSFKCFGVKNVAASCIWLASKVVECRRDAREIILVFHRMELRRNDLPIEHREPKNFADLKADMIKTERHLLIGLCFVCHVDVPHKLICFYLAKLKLPEKPRQEAWNICNDSLRTTLCLRFKSDVVACGVVYAAARRLQVPLPESPPWYEAFRVEKWQIDEVCRELAYLYSLGKPMYIDF